MKAVDSSGYRRTLFTRTNVHVLMSYCSHAQSCAGDQVHRRRCVCSREGCCEQAHLSQSRTEDAHHRRAHRQRMKTCTHSLSIPFQCTFTNKQTHIQRETFCLLACLFACTAYFASHSLTNILDRAIVHYLLNICGALPLMRTCPVLLFYFSPTNFRQRFSILSQQLCFNCLHDSLTRITLLFRFHSV